MINKIIYIIIAIILSACSSYKKPETLDGKHREPINKFRYTEPPLIVMDPATNRIQNSIPDNVTATIKNTRAISPIPQKTIDILDAEERASNNKNKE